MKNIPFDGFTLNPYTIMKPYDYFSGALGQMDTLRRANTYRARIHAVPDDFNQPLQPFETLEYEVKVAGGSYLWGVRFVQYSPTWRQQSPSAITVQITEACTGIELFREFTNPSAFAFYSAATEGRGYNVIHLLTEPRLFLDPGTITVEMCNVAVDLDTQYCQLLLHFAEPADLIEQKGVVYQ